MAFVAGMLLIDAPASALNNAEKEQGSRDDNKIPVKRIRTKTGDYPYVSAQAVRYWIRSYLERSDATWKAAPTRRESKIAYTDANPLLWADDDLFGYMRAPSKKAGARADAGGPELTPLVGEITRISPFRVSTLVSLGPVTIVDDFGTMARHDGDPVIHEHQFYRATLQGLFSLNLTTAGTFFNGGRVGYRNLDEVRVKLAEERKLERREVHDQPAFRLPLAERTQRVATLVRALGELEGGAKLTLHYTDVTPGLMVSAVVRGGNNPFVRVARADAKGQPEIVVDALKEVLKVYRDQILSDVYVGWARGYLDAQRAAVEALTPDDRSGVSLRFGHPRETMATLAQELTKESNTSWFD